MVMEPAAKAASDTILRSLHQTAPDAGVIGCLDVAIKVLMATGMQREQAIDALIATLGKFKEVKEG